MLGKNGLKSRTQTADNVHKRLDTVRQLEVWYI